VRRGFTGNFRGSEALCERVVFRGFACLLAGIILASCKRVVTTAGADSVVPANGPSCAPSLVHAPDLATLHAQHPPSMNAAGTLPLDNPKLQQILTKWPDPRSFISQGIA